MHFLLYNKEQKEKRINLEMILILFKSISSYYVYMTNSTNY